jgi:hypothetical protein
MTVCRLDPWTGAAGPPKSGGLAKICRPSSPVCASAAGGGWTSWAGQAAWTWNEVNVDSFSLRAVKGGPGRHRWTIERIGAWPGGVSRSQPGRWPVITEAVTTSNTHGPRSSRRRRDQPPRPMPRRYHPGLSRTPHAPHQRPPSRRWRHRRLRAPHRRRATMGTDRIHPVITDSGMSSNSGRRRILPA